MREILFRGKRTDNGEWLFGFPVTDQGIKCGTPNCICKHDGSDVYVMYFWDYASHEFDEFDVDPETVGQYTGLKDSTGKRIFEGDILEFWQPEYDLTDKSWGIVRYFADEDYPAFDIETLNVDSNGLSYIMANCECNIIGNIHDNPELLEVQG